MAAVNFNKNQDTTRFNQIRLGMSTLVGLCLVNDLSIRVSIGQEEQVPYLLYEIGLTQGPYVVAGKLYNTTTEAYGALLDVVAGKMTSALFPPTMIQTEDGKKIAYWKREKTRVYDLTTPIGIVPQQLDSSIKSDTTSWVGYDGERNRLITVPDGTANPDREQVSKVQYADVGPLGVLVFVFRKDNPAILEEGNATDVAQSDSPVMATAGILSMPPVSISLKKIQENMTSLSDRLEEKAGTAPIKTAKKAVKKTAKKRA